MKYFLHIIVFVIILPNFLFADTVEDWCGYNENTITELRTRYGKKEMRLLVSSLNQKDIDKMKKIYTKLDYNETKIWDMYKEDWTKESGPGFNILNKIIPKKVLVDTGIIKAIVAEIIWHEKMDKYGFLFDYQQIYNGDGIIILVVNPKFLMLSVQMAKKGIEVTEKMVVKAAFSNSFNPCK